MVAHFEELLRVNPELRSTPLYWRLSEKVQLDLERGFDEYFDVDPDGGFKVRTEWRDSMYVVRTRIALPAMSERMHYKVHDLRSYHGATQVLKEEGVANV